MPITPTDSIWMDGELVPWERATVHVLTHTLHYGTGAFEGIRAYPTPSGVAVFRLTEHIERLLASAKILMLDVPYSRDELVAATKAVVRENHLDDGCYIRPLVYLGYGEMGLNPLPSRVEVSIAVWPWGSYLGDSGVRDGVRVCLSSWRRNDVNQIPPAAKATGQYLNSSLAKVAALKAGYDEALLMSANGHVADGSGENVFLVKDGALYTPPLTDGPLEGITRASVMKMAADEGLAVHERHIVRTDCYLADEAFFTGTAAEIVPIREIDDRPVGTGRPGPVTQMIQDLFHRTCAGEVDRYKEWIDYVRD